MPRRLAQQVLARVLDPEEDAYSHLALDAALSRSELDARDRGLATELVYGTLTWLSAIDLILDKAVKGGTRRLDADVLLILRLSVYQLVFLDRVPPHAILDESAKLTKRVNHRAVGLVNGVLRALERAQQNNKITWWREQDREKKPARYLAQRYAMPTWLANRLWQMLGKEEAERAAAGLNSRPVTWARASSLPMPEGATPHPHLPGAYITQLTEETRQDPGVVIQDLGSQLIGWMAASAPSSTSSSPVRVLDACSGLGGKALHQAALLAATGQQGKITCVDPQASKLALLQQGAENNAAAEVEFEIFEGTLQSYAGAHQERDCFDLVLVDAPCTGLGTIRRHPEARWRRSEADIGTLAGIQKELLDVAATLVKPGGVLLYSVCTFSREEGSKQVERFLERHPDYQRAKPTLPEGFDWSSYLDAEGQLVTWPHLHDADAFFAARLERTA